MRLERCLSRPSRNPFVSLASGVPAQALLKSHVLRLCSEEKAWVEAISPRRRGSMEAGGVKSSIKKVPFRRHQKDAALPLGYR